MERGKSAIFATFCGESVLAGAMDKEGSAVVTLVCNIEQLCARVAHPQGWTQEHRDLLKALSLAKYVRLGEYHGRKRRPHQHEAEMHAVNDVEAHGSLWQDRLIGEVVQIPKNGKNLEPTLVSRESGKRRRLGNQEEEEALRKAGKVRGDEQWKLARECLGRGLVIVSSQDSAKGLQSLLISEPPSSASALDPPILEAIQEQGVAVGSLPQTWRSNQVYQILDHIRKQGVRQCLADLGTHRAGLVCNGVQVGVRVGA